MINSKHQIEGFVAQHQPCILVQIVDVKGSTPRESDAWMLVAQSATLGTIGGGQLEYMAMDEARRMFKRGQISRPLDIGLGPEIGQCCGGRVRLNLVCADTRIITDLCAALGASQQAQPHIYVFGAGHVGRALADAFSLLPVRVIVVDGRREQLQMLDKNVDTRLRVLPEAEVRIAPAGSAFIIATHDHALDFVIADQALQRSDAAYVGMIGSASKRGTFKSWYLAEGGDLAGLDMLVCPIGGKEHWDKRPEIIAALVVSEVLVHIHQMGAHQGAGAQPVDAGQGGSL